MTKTDAQNDLDSTAGIGSLSAGPAAAVLQWQSGAAAPTDGSPFWAWLHQSGIRLLRWSPPEEAAEHGGGRAEDYDGAFVEVHDYDSDWVPDWWLPADAIPMPPALALAEPSST